jgi:hypothetical protein
MEAIASNNFLSTGGELKPLVHMFSDLYGATSVFGLGGSGKTYLAESVLSSYYTNAVRQAHSCRPNDTVISNALECWFNSGFFTAASGVIVDSSWLEVWVQELLKGVSLDTYAKFRSLTGLVNPSIHVDFMSRIKLLQPDTSTGSSDSDTKASIGAALSLGQDKYPLYSFVLESGGDRYHALPIHTKFGEPTDLVVAFSADNEDDAPVILSSAKMKERERIAFNDVIEARLAKFAGNIEFATDPTVGTIEEGAWYCGVIPFIYFKIDSSVGEHKFFSGDDSYELCLTQNGLQSRKPDDLITHAHHTMTGFVDAVVERIGQLYADKEENTVSTETKVSVDRKPADMFNELYEHEPIILLEALERSGAIQVAIGRSAVRLENAYSSLRELVEELELVSKPSLVMTEMKAMEGYGAVAYNKDIELAGVQLSLKSKKNGGTQISYRADCSLVVASIGALMLSPVVHVSVLDATLSSDIAFNSATQKGGLDSSVLNRLQYISNVNTLAEGLTVIEMRDDFTISRDEQEANERARSTLGANSRIAVHITGTDSSPREIWVRVKGGDDVTDAWINLTGVQMDDYPANIVRSNEPRSFSDAFSAAKERMSAEVA